MIGVAPAVLALVDPSRHNNEMTASISFGQIVVGTYKFSGGYAAGGEPFSIPSVKQTLIVTVPHVGGRNFEWTGTKIKAFEASGAEVAAGTDLSLLGELRWWAMCR